jgi:hypothetical protein
MWRYKVYQGGRVVIKSPDNKKYVTHIEDILDLSCDDHERANMGPSDIKDYILKELTP